MSFGASTGTYALSVAATSGGVAIPVVASQQCRIVNTSATVAVFVQFGVTSATAVIPTPGSPNGAIAVNPNDTVVVDVPAGSNYVAMIGSAAGPTSVYFSFGKEV